MSEEKLLIYLFKLKTLAQINHEHVRSATIMEIIEEIKKGVFENGTRI